MDKPQDAHSNDQSASIDTDIIKHSTKITTANIDATAYRKGNALPTTTPAAATRCTNLERKIIQLDVSLKDKNSCIQLLLDSISNHEAKTLQHIQSYNHDRKAQINKIQKTNEKELTVLLQSWKENLATKQKLAEDMEQCMHRKKTLGSKIQSHMHSIRNQYQYTLSQNHEHFINGQKSRKQNYLHSKCSHVKNATWKALQPEMKQMRQTHKKELQCIQNEKETRVQCLETEMERDYKMKEREYQDECRGRMQVLMARRREEYRVELDEMGRKHDLQLEEMRRSLYGLGGASVGTNQNEGKPGGGGWMEYLLQEQTQERTRIEQQHEQQMQQLDEAREEEFKRIQDHLHTTTAQIHRETERRRQKLKHEDEEKKRTWLEKERTSRISNWESSSLLQDSAQEGDDSQTCNFNSESLSSKSKSKLRKKALSKRDKMLDVLIRSNQADESHYKDQVERETRAKVDNMVREHDKKKKEMEYNLHQQRKSTSTSVNAMIDSNETDTTTRPGTLQDLAQTLSSKEAQKILVEQQMQSISQEMQQISNKMEEIQLTGMDPMVQSYVKGLQLEIETEEQKSSSLRHEINEIRHLNELDERTNKVDEMKREHQKQMKKMEQEVKCTLGSLTNDIKQHEKGIVTSQERIEMLRDLMTAYTLERESEKEGDGDRGIKKIQYSLRKPRTNTSRRRMNHPKFNF